MTLNATQMANTRAELQANFKLADVTVEQVTDDLNISRTKLSNIMHLRQQSLEDPWIMRNYLLEKIEDQGKQPVPFTALSGDWHRHWFLNSRVIDAKQMTSGDY